MVLRDWVAKPKGKKLGKLIIVTHFMLIDCMLENLKSAGVGKFT